MKKFNNLDQYRKDIFSKMHLNLKNGSKILDLGCGDGQDCEVFASTFNLKVYGVDVMDQPKLDKKFHYKKGSIYKIPYEDNFFDYIFLHNVLHHIDDPKKRISKHNQAMSELKRVCKKNGKILILEGNRYNPLFYPHMVKIEGHDHFSQKYFYQILNTNFKKYKVDHFEAHLYPPAFLTIFKVYELIMDKISPIQFRAYNFANITNDK